MLVGQLLSQIASQEAASPSGLAPGVLHDVAPIYCSCASTDSTVARPPHGFHRAVVETESGIGVTDVNDLALPLKDRPHEFYRIQRGLRASRE